MERYYIAYGSNLNLPQMSYRCPDAEIVRTATLDNWALRFRGSKSGAYLTIEQKRGARTPVVIWKVSQRDEKHLDRYEGFPEFYYKRSIRVGDLDAFAYVMHEDRPIGVPTLHYMETCLEGYDSFHFNDRPIWRAYEHARKHSGERGVDLCEA